MELSIEIAIYHTENNDFDKAYEEYEDLLELSDNEMDLPMKAKAYRQLGECMLEMQRPLDALNHIKNYLKIANEVQDNFEIQRAYVTIGRCYLDLALCLKTPVSKESALIKSGNAFTKSLELCHNLSTSHTYDKTKSKSELINEFAEMKTISIFNLGLVNREKSKGATLAEKYFKECSVICLKHKMWEMFLRSTYQRLDMKYLQSLENQLSSSQISLIINEALTLVKSCFNVLVDVSFSSSMKKIRKEILELEGQCLVVDNQFLKAAKKFRNLMKRSHIDRVTYENKIKCASSLNRKIRFDNEARANSKDQIYIGMLYEELNIIPMAARYYKLALSKLKEEENPDCTKLVNRLISVNQSAGLYEDNISLLEEKLKLLLRDKSNEKMTANRCCRVIEQLLNCWLRSSNAQHKRDRVLSIIEQLDSLSIVADSLSTQVAAVRATINAYEELSIPALKTNLEKSREKLRRLEALTNNSEEENDLETEEPDLSEVEQWGDESSDFLSSDSDVDLRALTEGQIEELEAVGKRTKPGPSSSFIKKNEKGETLLHVAAINGNLKQVEKLVNQLKHPLDIVDSAGWTALHDSANHGHTKIVQFLLDKGSNMEHTGPVIDCSTPLMEAVHGGNIDTAILLIELGANLWHKNRKNENLGDCIDAWRHRCQQDNSYGEREATAYIMINRLIRKQLGGKYIEWCHDRKSGRIVTESGEDHVDKESKPCSQDVILNRRLLDRDESSENDSQQIIEKNLLEIDSDPVHEYRSSIQSVGKKAKISSQDTKFLRSNSEAGYVIGDDWLEDDIGGSKSQSKISREPDYGAYTRISRKRLNRNIEFDNDATIPPRRRVKKQSEQSSCHSDDLFDENSCITIDDVVDTSTLDSMSIDQNDAIQPTLTTVSTVSILYRSKSLLVPLEAGCTVEWLAKETARRFSLLTTNQADNLPNVPDIKICTEDGSWLLPSDSLHGILRDLVSSSGLNPIKLIATDIILSNSVPARYQTFYQSALKSEKLLNLSNSNLGQDLPDFLACLQKSDATNGFQKILLDHNGITDDMITRTFPNRGRTMNFASFIFSHVTTLQELDLSYNKITGSGFSFLLQALRSKGVFGKLETLNLTFNPIGRHDFCVLSLIIKPILVIFPSLKILKLSSCEISNFSELCSIRASNKDEILSTISELDLSRNPLIMDREKSNLYFWKSVGTTLRHLSLEGCGRSLDMTENPKALIFDLVSSIVDSIVNRLITITSLDLSDCSLDFNCVHQINRLFMSKNSNVSHLLCQSNSDLGDCSSTWFSLVHGLCQPMCKISQLSIDLPLVTNHEDFLSCIYTIKEKIQIKFGTKLVGLHLKIRPDHIPYVTDAIFEHGFHRLSESDISLSDRQDNRLGHEAIHFSTCLVLAIVDAFRDQNGNENVRVHFAGDLLKIVVF